MKFSHKLAIWLMLGLSLGTFVFAILAFMGQPATATQPGSPTTATNSTPR